LPCCEHVSSIAITKFPALSSQNESESQSPGLCSGPAEEEEDNTERCQLLLQTNISTSTQAPGWLPSNIFLLPQPAPPRAYPPNIMHTRWLQCCSSTSPFQAAFVHLNLICWAKACSLQLAESPGNPQFCATDSPGTGKTELSNLNISSLSTHRVASAAGRRGFSGSLSSP
jgi:hypothetical protein